jgi:acyl-CoA thioester hydrolase
MNSDLAPVPGNATATWIEHRVAFYETDAMGVVHHSNYLRFFEEARAHWLEEHDLPYSHYMDSGIHLAVTRSEVDHHRGARFDDRLSIATWLDWIRGASMRMAYSAAHAGELVASGSTEHAAIGPDGGVRRIPREARARLLKLAPGP